MLEVTLSWKIIDGSGTKPKEFQILLASNLLSLVNTELKFSK
jgi:hypothetical protein